MKEKKQSTAKETLCVLGRPPCALHYMGGYVANCKTEALEEDTRTSKSEGCVAREGGSMCLKTKCEPPGGVGTTRREMLAAISLR
ncbi:hypothetical protein ETH_00031350 [Eimeria tenella]|uniref:Uncharacterized protein n=1 Tax=Eimeria tenella TaxID=5802 RepID=U6L1A8_EIMTE|nr:hypothetical protein ETH_00031350 [Eimeria tenella]CDJ42973.1 hypothetical protein ETH_00031350 [Eimeria tenella]|eukprot:XP_013233723.1 hypothetical protein ETH_00031350 [Eimeria tenella]